MNGPAQPTWSESMQAQVTTAFNNKMANREADRLIAELDAKARQPIVLVPAAEIRKRVPAPYLVDGMMPAYGIGVMFGETGTYKSFLVLNLLLCVGAKSAAFLGHMVNGSGWGIYVMGEGQYDAGLRLDAAVSHHAGFTDERLAYIEQAFPLSDEAAVGEVIERGRELVNDSGVPVRLVVFDSFADFYGAGDSENSSTDMQRLIASMKRISAALGCVVMAIAHTGHGGQDEDGKPLPPPQRLRGSSRFRQAFDFEWMATGSSLACTKNRYGPKFDRVPYKTEPAGGSLAVSAGVAVQADERDEWREWPYPATCGEVDQVCEAVRQTPGMTMTDVAKVLRKNKHRTHMALLQAEQGGLITNAGTKSAAKYKYGGSTVEFMEYLTRQSALEKQ